MKYLVEAVRLPERIRALNKAFIPVIEVPSLGPITKPTERNLEGDLPKILQKKLELGENIVLKTKHHVAFALENPGPHHPEGSIAVWTAEIRNNEIVLWHKNSWLNLVKDKDYVDGLEYYLKIMAKTGKSTYMFFGFLHPGEKVDKNLVYDRASMSMYRQHGHIVNPFSPEHYSYFLNLDSITDEDYAQRLNFFANIAGEAAIVFFNNVLKDFSNFKFIYEQPLFDQDGNQTATYPRTLFGFTSLHEAFSRILWLQNQMSAQWMNFATEIFKQTPAYLHPALTEAINFFKQSPVITGPIIIPNEAEKLAAGNTDPVWVAPFSIANALHILKGVILKKQAVT